MQAGRRLAPLISTPNLLINYLNNLQTPDAGRTIEQSAASVFDKIRRCYGQEISRH